MRGKGRGEGERKRGEIGIEGMREGERRRRREKERSRGEEEKGGRVDERENATQHSFCVIVLLLLYRDIYAAVKESSAQPGG